MAHSIRNAATSVMEWFQSTGTGTAADPFIVGNALIDRHDGTSVHISQLGLLAASSMIKLSGAAFVGNAKDTNFWTETVANGGTAVQAQAEILLDTNTTANGSAQYQTNRVGPWVAGTENAWIGTFALPEAALTDNLRRWGAFTTVGATLVPENGAWFQDDVTDGLSIGYRSLSQDAGGPVVVPMASWSSGETIVLGTGINTFIITYDFSGVSFYINKTLVHRLDSGNDVWTDDMNSHNTFQTINSNSAATSNSLMCHVAAIFRLGETHTYPAATYIAGGATTVLKRGPGILHKVVNGDKIASSTVQIYDGVTAVNQLAYIDGANVLGDSGLLSIPFFDGLTIVTVGAGLKVTVTYE